MNTTNVYQRHPPPSNDDEHQEKTSILNLPMDLTADIFNRLPGKSLVQCKYVCSTWRRYLLNPSFTKPLFPQTRCCLLIRIRDFPIRRKNRCATVLIDLDKKDSKPNVDFGLQLPTDLNLPTKGLDIVGSCNGLLCLVDRSAQYFKSNPVAQYYISNPITGESFTLPSVRFTKPKCKQKSIYSGFGFSPVSHVFKILATFLTEHDQEEAMVLTIRSGRWRSLGLFSHRHDFTDSERKIYLNGFLYWLSSSWNTSTVSICSFEVEREVFQLLPSFTVGVGADDPSFCDCKLRVLRGCLSLFVKRYMGRRVSGDNIISIWMMKNDSIKESWTKQYEIRNSELPAALPSLYINQVVEFTEEGQILKLHRSQLLVYKCEMGLVWVEGDHDGILANDMSVCVHIPSFVPLRDMIRGI